MTLPMSEQIALATLRKGALAHLSSQEWAEIESEVVAAGGITKATGYAGDMVRRAAIKMAPMVKAKPMKTEGGEQFPAEAYAFVPDPEMPSTWKLRLWDSPTEKETRRQVGYAVAALGKGYRGNKVELPADARDAVVARVAEAWRKVNSELTEDEMPSVLKAKQTFGGNRSAAASYAANMRWRKSNPGGLSAAQGVARRKTDRKFGTGGRSAASSYAAQMRWRKSNPGGVEQAKTDAWDKAQGRFGGVKKDESDFLNEEIEKKN